MDFVSSEGVELDVAVDFGGKLVVLVVLREVVRS